MTQQRTQLSPQGLFDDFGGATGNGFPAIHAAACRSPQGTPYLQAPGVVLLAKPQVQLDTLQPFLDGFEGSLQFAHYLDDPVELESGAQLCKLAGQTCYASFSSKRTMNANAQRYFENLISSGHGSVLEHANFSFLLYGISRSLTHEMVRHRAGFGYSQLSQRYVSGRVLRFVERPEFQDDGELHERFLQRIDSAYNDYHALAESMLAEQESGKTILSAEHRTDLRKKVNQSARAVLPNETETLLVVTGNVRAWRHFIEMRASDHSEIEIRALAVRIFLCLRLIEPILFGDYAITKLADETHSVATDHPKV